MVGDCARCGRSWAMHQGVHLHQGHPVVCEQFEAHLAAQDPGPDPERVEALEHFYACMELRCRTAFRGYGQTSEFWREQAQECLDRAPKWPLG